MTPYEEARLVYGREPCRRTFAEDLELHLHRGFVFSTPEFFIMGRPVWHLAPESMIVDPRIHFPADRQDCWHIYLFAGDMARAWSILPRPLPWFSFERKNELRLYPSQAIHRLSAARQPAVPTPA